MIQYRECGTWIAPSLREDFEPAIRVAPAMDRLGQRVSPARAAGRARFAGEPDCETSHGVFVSVERRRDARGDLRVWPRRRVERATPRSEDQRQSAAGKSTLFSRW